MAESVENIAWEAANRAREAPDSHAASKIIEVAIRRALEGARVRVKALEWGDVCRRNGVWASCLFGTYHAWVGLKSGRGYFVLNDSRIYDGGHSLEAAKAAAQEDFARRVRACLEGEA